MSASTDSPSATVAVSDELIAPLGPDLELCYQTFGSPGDEPLLLVMGLGGPMTWWPQDLCVRLAEQGFHVIRYDNRDTGRSSRFPARVRRSHLLRAFVGAGAPAPYSLSDLAGDAVGLLDHLGFSTAHVAGVSMGGMIAQTLALEHPDRVRSLTSLMATTGRRTVGWQHPRLLPSLLWSRSEREGYIESSQKLWRLIGSPEYPTSETELRDRAGETFDRGMSRAGVMRQMLAILTQHDRTEALERIVVPSAVLHGQADRMVHVSGGRATAAAIPGAELVLVDGWGHDLPEGLFDTFATTIRRTAVRAGAARS